MADHTERERAMDTACYGLPTGVLDAIGPDGVNNLIGTLRDLRDACTEAYKAGRIPAEPFVRAGNVLASIRDALAKVE